MASELLVITRADADQVGAVGVVDLLDHLERRWSRFLPDSDVTRINLAAGAAVSVDPMTITLLLAMIEAWRTTDHRFDPTTLPALMTAGYSSSIEDDRRVTILPDGTLHLGGLDDAPVTLGDVEIDTDAGRVRLPPGLVVDAGGIGKGLAADLAVGWLLDHGAAGALVSIGGDIVAGGDPSDGGWTVAIEHPAGGEVGVLSVAGAAIATSSTRSRRWRHDGREQHHLIDPWTGEPSTTDLWSVTVIARSGWLAEAHATAALLAGGAHVVEHLERHDLSGLAVTSDGRVLTTGDLDELRHVQPPDSPVIRTLTEAPA